MNQTLEFYNQNASEYASDMGAVDPNISQFMALCVHGGRVLELGTGSGADAKALLAAGYDVDPTDGSPELALIASRQLGREVRVMKFDEISAENAYDGIYACASLTHATRESLPKVVNLINRALRDSGVVWASFKLGTGEGSDQFGRYYNYYSARELLEIWQQNGEWGSLDVLEWEGSGYDNLPTLWGAVVGRL